MRKFWYGLFFMVVVFAAYAGGMYFLADSTRITAESRVKFPLEKVYPNLVSPQKFSAWFDLFSDKDLTFEYFSPYEGVGSGMTFTDKKNPSKSGEMYLRYEKPDTALRYLLYYAGDSAPYVINIKLKKAGAAETDISWQVFTPKLPYLARYKSLFAKDKISGGLSRSFGNLENMLGKKVDREGLLSKIKFDSMMVENIPAQNLLGINVSASNKKDDLPKNIVLNHNKVKNFIMMDMGKKDDEFGLPVMITDPENLKDKEISYFYGIPLAGRSGLTDNNFTFTNTQAGKAIVLYYKGTLQGRIRAIQMMMAKAKKDTLRTGRLQETFLEEPAADRDFTIKMALPVYR